MATITANTGSNNWNTNGAWVGGVQPTAADDVVIPASAVVTLPGSTTCYCRSLTVQASATLVWSNNTGVVLQVGDGTAGAGNVAVSISGTATISLLAAAGFGAINLASTSATQQTVSTGGKTLPNVTFGSASGNPSYLLSGAMTSNNTVTLTYGTLNTNGQTCSWGSFSSSNSNTRTLTLGSSSITLSQAGTATNAWHCGTTTNMTVTANTATLTMTGASARVYSSSRNWNGLSLVFTGSGACGYYFEGGTGTFANVTHTGTAAKTDTVVVQNGELACTGTFTVNGNSATNRVLVYGFTAGTARTITAAAVSMSNVDFMDITAAGAANWNLSAITGLSGDCGGNSGMTLTTPAPQTHTASAGGNWSDPTKWTSRVPLPQDDVTVDVNTTGTITMDMPRIGRDINFTGFVGTLIPASQKLFGSLTMSAGMTVSAQGDTTFAGRGSHTITSAGQIVPSSPITSCIFMAPGGTYTLQDAFIHSNSVRLYNGTLNSNNQTMTVGNLIDVGTATRSFVLGTSTINITLTSTSGSFSASATGMTMSAASATFIFSTAATVNRAFTGAGFSYGTVRYTVANSPGSLTFSGANTIGTLNIGPGRQLVLPSSTTNTITNFNVAGANFGYVYLPGVTSNYLNTPDSAPLAITGDIDIRVRVALDDWTPSVQQTILEAGGASGVPPYGLYVQASGGLRAQFSLTGAAQLLPSSSVSTSTVGITDGQPLWIRVTRRASDGRVQFFTASGALASPVAADFAQLGTDTAAGTGTLYDGTGSLGIGGQYAGNPTMIGKLYRAQIRNNILDNGTGIVFDADLSTKTLGADTFTESSTNAATVTINGALAQVGDGRISLTSSTPSTPATLTKAGNGKAYNLDYLAVKDITAGPSTWYAGVNSVNKGGNTGWNFGSRTPGSLILYPNLPIKSIYLKTASGSSLLQRDIKP